MRTMLVFDVILPTALTSIGTGANERYEKVESG
jgi:hypothetical protein